MKNIIKSVSQEKPKKWSVCSSTSENASVGARRYDMPQNGDVAGSLAHRKEKSDIESIDNDHENYKEAEVEKEVDSHHADKDI